MYFRQMYLPVSREIGCRLKCEKGREWMGQKWRDRCLVAIIVVLAAGVSMLIFWLLGCYLSYGNAKEKEQNPMNRKQEMQPAAKTASHLKEWQETCSEGEEAREDRKKELQASVEGLQAVVKEPQTTVEESQAPGQELQEAVAESQASGQLPELNIQKLQSDCEIRVLLLGDSYQESCHQSVLVTSEHGLLVKRFLTGEVTDETKIDDTENNDAGTGSAYDTEAENTNDAGTGSAYDAEAENINDAGAGNAYDAEAENGDDTGAGNAYDAEAENTDDTGAGDTADIEAKDTDAFLTDAEPVGSSYEIAASDLRLGEALCIVPQEDDGVLTLPGLIRAENPPQYSGRLFLYRTGEGILVVNHLPLERYLPGVVASEMPSDYPLQAQMAQAVCARTYAYRHLLSAREGDAVFDLDDSTACQVYNNYQADAVSTAAVEATRGELLDCDEVLYYSTSCGINGRENLSKEQAFREFLAGEPEKGLEYGSPWVRWSARITKRELMRQAQKLFAYTGTLDTVTVQSRRADGQVQELMLAGVGGSLLISGEYEIRRVLAPGADGVILQNQQRVSLPGMLPSAWFWAEVSEDAVLLHGGGYGHGTGMSQCGAAAMAASGADYREILRHYYGESE